MDKKKNNQVPSSTVTRDLDAFSKPTGNIYKSVAIMAKRSNQIAQNQKQDLEQRLQEFSTYTMPGDDSDTNEEQVEISRFYEKMPKPVLIAAKEFIEGELAYRETGDEQLHSTNTEHE